MGYELIWFFWKSATCDAHAVVAAIGFEENRASLELLDASGVTIPGLQIPKVTPPQQTTDELLREIDATELRKKIAARMTTGWSVIDDTTRETSWDSGGGGGAVQLSWDRRYVIGSGYGNFAGGMQAVHDALKAEGFVCFDPQTNEIMP